LNKNGIILVMSERDLSRINGEAERLANCVTQYLKEDGIDNAVVWVTYDGHHDMPLAVRTPDNYGFGFTDYAYYFQFKAGTRQAELQARYGGGLSAGRSVEEQEDKLRKTDRKATSYSPRLSVGDVAGYAIDPTNNLVVSAVAKDVTAMEMAKISERAVAKLSSEPTHLPKMLEASKWMHECYELLGAKLPKGASGIAMIALPHYYELLERVDPMPVVVASQAVGKTVDVFKYDIVAAKVKAVVVSGLPSGRIEGPLHDHYSNIQGGLPANFGRYGDRVVALGGLLDTEDVALIHEIAQGEVGTQLQVSLLSEFAR
jgi:hypothetical protein